MTTEIATYSMAGQTFDVEIIEDFSYGMTEVIAIGCYPFFAGASHATVETSHLHNRRTEEIPADMPIFEPPIEITDDLDADRTRAYLQAVYEGAA